MSKLSFKEWSILSDLGTIELLGEDQEFSMARGELKTAQEAIKRLMGKLNGEGDLEAWVQSKITKAAEYLDTVADHLSYGEDDTKRIKEVQVKEDWSEKYKKSINCDSPKGFSQRAHCQSRKKKIKEDVDILDADGKIFARVIDIIKGSDYKFKSFTQPIFESAVKELEVGLKKLDNTSYDSIDALMHKIMKEHDMTAKELHNAFVKKHDKTPDDWVKGLSEKCWDGYKQVGMKKKGKKIVPNCVKEDSIDEKCWTGYKKKGMKTMFGKKYPNCVKEEGLRDWFGKSKSKDGKSGWVNVVTGGTCASDEPGEGTPKCVSSSKRSSMTDTERESASRRKKLADPGQQSKTGASKPTYVSTDVKEESDNKTKGSGTKDACYSKVKSRYDVWPSAYASGALVKCRKVGAANWGNKTKKKINEIMSTDALSYEWDTDIQDGQQYPLLPTKHRYCPKCKKNETKDVCRYGPKYWSLFSLPPKLSSDSYDPNDISPANEQMSFEIGSGHKQVQKQAKIRNLATGTTNEGEKKNALRKLSGPSLPLADSVIQPGQLTTEDYQRIQSTGNVYSILFSWRGRPMMNLQLFFPNMKRPSKDEVKDQIEKLYPGAVVMQWYPSPTDPTKPIIVIQNK